MKLGIGLYRHQLTPDNLAYAKQLGCTHLVVHMVDYFNKGVQDGGSDSQPIGDTSGWGITEVREPWSVEELISIKVMIELFGLVWEAIENFDPGVWYDILLGGPEKETQIQKIQQLIRNLGQVGILLSWATISALPELLVEPRILPRAAVQKPSAHVGSRTIRLSLPGWSGTWSMIPINSGRA